jgi:phage-related protein
VSRPIVLLGDVEKHLKQVKDRMGAVATLLLCLQDGETLEMPHSRPMPTINSRCHELRFKDGRNDWRIIYRTDSDAIILSAMFKKKGNKTPKQIIEISQTRLKKYDEDCE